MRWFRSRKQALREARERATRGAELLDEKRPGWAAAIDRKRLDMGSVCNCVLGQLYKDFSDGLNAICSYATVVDVGFVRSSEVCCPTLKKAWLELIEERLTVPV